MSFTWYDEDNSFSPGRLDYIIYSSSVLKNENSYVLFTPAIDADTLTKYNLELRDVVVASDHLPVVTDFSLKNLTDVNSKKKVETPTEFKLLQNYPNPFNPTTTIEYTLPSGRQVFPSSSVISNPLAGERSHKTYNSEIPTRREKNLQDFSSQSSKSNGAPQNDNFKVETHGHASVQLVVYDILGREIKILVNQPQNPGSYSVQFNASELSSGIYYYKLSYDSFTQVKKMIVLK